jgi:DMSO/TMAO reductase YedYZ molybdopterin-dependent catalytic subunit
VGLLLPTAGGLVTLWSLRRLLGRIATPLPGGAAQALPASLPGPGAASPPRPTSLPPTPTLTPAPPTATGVLPPPPLAPGAGVATVAPRPTTGTAVHSLAIDPASPTTAPVPTPTVVPSPTVAAAATGPAIPSGVAPQVTPTERFYVIAKDFFAPALEIASWQLAITGLVGQSRTLRYTDLLALPAVSLAATLECIGNEASGGLISTAVWTGVPLGALLDGATVRPGATHVVFTCADDYVEILPLEQARDPATLLVHTMNGAALTAQHGFPARLYTPGRYGMKNPKWVVRIEVTSRPIRGYWTERGWDPDAPIAAFTRIDTPTPLQPVPPGPTRVGGVAFAGDRGISRVELSTDDGATWQLAELEPALSPLTWVRWAATWVPRGPGRYFLVARAYEADGTPQAAETRKPGPGGATGYARVPIVVSS